MSILKHKVVMLFTLLCALAICSVSFASKVIEHNIDWAASVITVEGNGVAPANAATPAQAKMLARRAAIVDGYRNLAEIIKGVQVDSETTVENLMVANDTIRSKTNALIQGARIVKEEYDSYGGGSYVITMAINLFGESHSLAEAVMPAPPKYLAPEPIPPVETVVISRDPINNPPAKIIEKVVPRGTYTGLIIDCRDIEEDVSPSMSPMLKNESGMYIFKYTNLDHKKVIRQGMVTYSHGDATIGRAGAIPLIVKAIRLEDHRCNPVLDAETVALVLKENATSRFLENGNVVIMRR